MKKSIKCRVVAVIMGILMVASMLALTGCGTDDIDISSYEDSVITLHIVTDNDAEYDENRDDEFISSTEESEQADEVGADEAEIMRTDTADIQLTIADLKAMDCKTLKTHSTSDKIGEVKATGPELATVLEKYGYEKSDFARVSIKGSDEYDARLTGDYILEHDIYLAFGIDGEPLDEESAPCRVIIPESDSAYWTRMVTDITLEMK